MALDTGDKAPDFSLIADNGKPFKLSSKLKGNALLVFYPGDGLPVCKQQLSDYRDSYSDFNELGVEVIAISGDDAGTIKSFKKEHNLPFTLLSDADGEVSKQYDSFGWFGVKRSVYLVDKDLEVKYKHIESVSIYSRSVEELTEMIKRKV
ncbi:peroxiredoxin [Marinicella sp. S1101]|uniref:peroxiredoxin n=1 Tax=Marinicella marina TaxID=2996016 RepID=UPI002260AF10|nr:peroxiredoxin [Marinicella marina]MCX7555003.1 peroxiredoxin [Marinicella marina]MDJ1141333.1 peroxiredoxin [Marinicella marina]